ncbi:condensation domain-containing protein [Streptomyces sp. NPDC001286]
MSDRAELGEIRAALVSLPGVRDAAVHAARHAPGGLRIVAHVVTRTPPAELRAALRARLPSHLLPALVHRVPHIPLLPDGRTDQRALAALTAAASNAAPTPGEESRWAAASVPVTPQQRALLPHALTHRGTGRWVQQLHWRWHGPLDAGRFTAAWQSVFAHESVLRAAFACDSGPPRLILHEHVRPEVVRHRADSVDFDHLRERDRLRGFDLRRPGLLRLHLLDEPAPLGGGPPPVRILLSFHTLALDDFSLSVLLEEFYRAYLAGGRLPGGERRPDHRDYARWLADQDTAPARDFWSTATPDTTTLIRPGTTGPATGLSGYGRTETRLGPAAAGRLRTWAASHAATEAGALQAAWALLLYRAGAAAGPALVGFGVGVLGRGIGLDFVERLPGLLATALPMTVRVDPDAPVARLLADLRELAWERAAYEWVSLEQIRAWSGRPSGDELLESLVVFEHRRRRSPHLRSALAAHGITVEEPRPAGTPTVFPVTLQARRDADDGLHLSAVHDRARLADADAARLLGQCARLLRELPRLAGGAATVSDALAVLADEPPPAMAGAPAASATGAPT